MENLAQQTQSLVNEITKYLNNTPEIITMSYSQSTDIEFIHNQYSKMMNAVVTLSKLIVKSEAFQARLRITISNLSENTTIESKKKNETKQCLFYITEISKPLYEEKDRLTKGYFYYEKMYKTYVSPM